MLPLMSKVAVSLLLSAATFMNPTTPNALSFEANAYVMTNNQVRVVVQKDADAVVTILLRNKSQEVLYRQIVGKKESAYAVKLDVDALVDGTYELEFKSEKGSIRKQLNLTTPPVQKPLRTIAMQ
ncbi:DUF3244 domain-containing protein [Spirosoma profusum]|nr:hypothetical protein [Spirosoma profusum]